MTEATTRRRPAALALWALVAVIAAGAGVAIWAWAFRGASAREQTAHAYADLVAGPSATVLDMAPIATAVWKIKIAESSGATACWIIDVNRFQIHAGRAFDGAGRVKC